MAILLNIGSAILGIIALILPFSLLYDPEKLGFKKLLLFSAGSLGTCGIALVFQICYNRYLVIKQDWGALTDITHTTATAALMLFVIVMALNIAAIYAYFKSLKGAG